MNVIKTSIMVVALFITTQSGFAGDRCCPDCGCKTCSPSIVPVTTKHHCYEVECKDICIPKFSWPWEKCCKPGCDCVPKCGRVKTVKVLKKIDYKCEKCGCKWEVTCVERCKQGGCCEPTCIELPASEEYAAPLPPAARTRAGQRGAGQDVYGPQVSSRRGAKSSYKRSLFDIFVKSVK